jgi:hypothetical protein
MEEIMPDAIEQLLADYSPDVQSIAYALRALAQATVPEAHEILYHATINYALPDSTSYRFCYIAPQKSYVNLGFYFGTHLPDPEHLLQGEGARMRHVKVRTVAEGSNPALGDLIKAAWLDAPNSFARFRKKT